MAASLGQQCTATGATHQPHSFYRQAAEFDHSQYSMNRIEYGESRITLPDESYGAVVQSVSWDYLHGVHGRTYFGMPIPTGTENATSII